MSGPHRLLVAACSGRKRDPGYTERRMQLGVEKRATRALVDLYDGPAWRMIRNAYACGGALVDGETEVWALSARHGLCPSFTFSTVYDERLESVEQAEALADRWRSPDDSRYFANTARAHREIVVFGSAVYGAAFARYCDIIEAHHGVVFKWERFNGGIGTQLGKLRRWLDGGTS